jgi:group I intron endonuclease
MKNILKESIRLSPESLIQAVKVYKDVLSQRKDIARENEGKCGVYRWTNTVNKKSYIGSSAELDVRFRGYFTPSRLNSRESIIYKALLKYGFSKFTFEILEYCSIDNLIKREQYYIDLLKPVYNLCKIAGSPRGRIVSEETRAKLRVANTGYKHTKEALEKISIASRSRTEEQREKLSAKNGREVVVTNLETKEVTKYCSLRQASRKLNIPLTSLYKCLKGKRAYDIYEIVYSSNASK